jgi:hypothetical protein
VTQLPWMSGSEALRHICNVKKCDRSRAYKYLHDFCIQGVIEGRARGCEQDRDWHRDRGLGEEIPEDKAWKERFIYSANEALSIDHRYLNEFAEKSEFNRQDIVHNWPVEARETDPTKTATLLPGDTPAALPPKASGRRASPFWTGAHVAAKKWLDEYGCPASGDGHQAELEKHITGYLSNQGHDPAESTIRRYVGCWIKQRRAELGSKG